MPTRARVLDDDPPAPSTRISRRSLERTVRLTDELTRATATRPGFTYAAVLAVALGLASVFAINRATASVPFQHLYYVPIILASLWFGRGGGWSSALAAIALYHAANPALLARGPASPMSFRSGCSSGSPW